MTTAEYWRDRAEMVMARGLDKADVVLRDLQKMYAQAARDVQAEIDKLYRMYAQESGLSYADAQAYLNRAERTEWRMTLAEYVDRINATGDKALLAELNALAAQSRVRRFRQVLTAIDVAASELRSGGEKLTEKLLRGTYRSAYRMAGDLLAGGTLEALNPASVAQALAYPWSGASFSDRIWSNAEQLAQTLRRTVTQGLIQGQDVRQMAAGVQKVTGAAMHRAETLIRTETARCIEDGTLAGYKAAGVERYQILVSPDSRTCDACARLDGAVFRVDEAVTGVNYPPFHPNCRDTTVPYFSGEELARWEQLGAGMEGGTDGRSREESQGIVRGKFSVEEMPGGVDSLREYAILEKIREDIRTGRYPKTLQKNRQMRHIPGNEAYDQYAARYAAKNEYGPSRVTISLVKIRELIERYAGTGVLKMDRNGQWTHTEIIMDNDEVIGVAVNNRTGAEAPTTVFKIHYASDGAHLVPDYPSKKRRREK